MSNYRFIISGGGTGGHVYPAIAIANELKKTYPMAAFLFVGALGKMEMKKVPQAGYEIVGLPISGFQRKKIWKNFSILFKLFNSLIKARKLLKKFKPHLAIGTGGYASAPLLKMASWSKIPYVIQEQNAYAGVTNKLLASKAAFIFVAWTGMQRWFPASKLILSGNPIRTNMLQVAGKKTEGCRFFGYSTDNNVLLVLGGSLGAARINQLLASEHEFLLEKGLQIIWQCGNLYYERYKHLASPNLKITPFLERMDMAYAAADIIISRAGAITVSELCMVGKAVLLIPSPNVAENHQFKNAKQLYEKKAALVLEESDLDRQFRKAFSQLLKKEKRQELGNNIKKLEKPEAAKHIAQKIKELL